MKSEEIQKLLARASSLVAMRQEYVPEFQSVLAKGQLLQKNIRECGEQIRSLTLEDCIKLIPEARKPKIIKFPDNDLADTVLLQLNPLTHYAVWIFPTRVCDTQGWFRFNLGGFPSRVFYQICWCASCIDQEDREKFRPKLVELCASHGIMNVLLRYKDAITEGSKWACSGKNKVRLFDGCFLNSKNSTLKNQSTSFIFEENAGKDKLGQHIWLKAPGTSGVKIEAFPEDAIFVN